MESAKLLSLKALTDLDGALGRFGSCAKECLDTAEVSLRRQMAELVDRLQESEHQVRICAINCDEASDDEAEYAAQALAEAEERLSLIRHWQRRADEACQAYFSVARRFKSTVSAHIPKAQLKLRTKHDEGAAYLSVQMEGDVQSLRGAAVPQVSKKTPRITGTPRLNSIAQFPLPAGFRWVSLEHISHYDDLRRNEGFGKASEHDMRRAFGTLRRQVLPYLKEHPDTTDDTFRELDGYTAEGTIKPRQLAYQVFFGDEPIVLDEHYSNDGMYSVTNGRHRIQVARDMGWSAVPVRVVGKSKGKP